MKPTATLSGAHTKDTRLPRRKLSVVLCALCLFSFADGSLLPSPPPHIKTPLNRTTIRIPMPNSNDLSPGSDAISDDDSFMAGGSVLSSERDSVLTPYDINDRGGLGERGGESVPVDNRGGAEGEGGPEVKRSSDRDGQGGGSRGGSGGGGQCSDRNTLADIITDNGSGYNSGGSRGVPSAPNTNVESRPASDIGGSSRSRGTAGREAGAAVRGRGAGGGGGVTARPANNARWVWMRV